MFSQDMFPFICQKIKKKKTKNLKEEEKRKGTTFHFKCVILQSWRDFEILIARVILVMIWWLVYNSTKLFRDIYMLMNIRKENKN